MLGARYRGELIAAASVCSSRTHPWRRDTSVSSVLIAVSGDASTRVRSRCDSPAESLCCSEGVNEVPAARMRYDGEGGICHLFVLYTVLHHVHRLSPGGDDESEGSKGRGTDGNRIKTLKAELLIRGGGGLITSSAHGTVSTCESYATVISYKDSGK